ncbi:hypothetical protein LguiA_020274 [Lonicera macranthoides]
MEGLLVSGTPMFMLASFKEASIGFHPYKRELEDIQLMVDTGLEAYRFSISWSRLIPRIEPHVTLFHNDLPQALEDEYGGWLSRKSKYIRKFSLLLSHTKVNGQREELPVCECRKDFVAFANVCFREFGDRVSHWTTFNEPNAFSLAGYDMGVIPPGRCSSPFGPYCIQGNSSWEPYMVTHNILLAHASASSLYRKKYKAMQHGMIGLDLLAYWFAPYTNATEDIAAAQRTLDFWVGWLLNPLIFGDYPDIVKKNAGRRIPVFTKDESALIQGSIDFLAVNHYDTLYVRDKSSNLETDNRDLSADMAVEVDLNPWGLQALLEYFKRAYGNPPHGKIVLAGYRTTRNGTLDDKPRVEFMHAYIGSLLDAVRSPTSLEGSRPYHSKLVVRMGFVLVQGSRPYHSRLAIPFKACGKNGFRSSARK